MLTDAQRDEVLSLISQELKTYFTVKRYPGLIPSDAPATGPGPGNTLTGMVAVFSDNSGREIEGRSLLVEEDSVTLTLFSALALALNSADASIVEAFPDGHIEIRIQAGGNLVFEVDGVNHLKMDGTGLILPTAGDGISIKEGTDGSMGVATLSGGTILVTNSKVTAATRIFLTPVTASVHAGHLDTATRSAGASFTINSDNVLDDREIAYLLLEPAA